MTKINIVEIGLTTSSEFKNNYIRCMLSQETVMKYIVECKPMTVLSPCKAFLKADF